MAISLWTSRGSPISCAARLEAGSLRFTADREDAAGGAELVWIAYDTPVDADDRADVAFVVERARALVEASDPNAVILVSSQLPVGTTRLLEQSSPPGRTFACSPENLRLGAAIETFEQPDRIVVGIRPDRDRSQIEELFGSSRRAHRVDGRRVGGAREARPQRVSRRVRRIRQRARDHRGARRRRRRRGRTGPEDRAPDRAARLPQAGCRVRGGNVGARRRLPDPDRRARACPDPPLACRPREQRRAQALGAADARVARRRRRRPDRPRHRGLGSRLQARDGHPATVELGRALPRAHRCGSRRSSPRLGRASPARRPLRQLHALPDARWRRRRVHRPSSSRPIGPPTARSTREGSWRRCGHRSSSTRTAFSRPRSATSPECATSGSGAGRGDWGPRRENGDRHRGQPRSRPRDRAGVPRSGRAGARVRARRRRPRPRSRRARGSRVRPRIRRGHRGRRLASGGRRPHGRRRPGALFADRRARQQRRHLWPSRAHRGGRLGRVGARRAGEPPRLGPVLSRGAPPLPGERLREDHPALRWRRHVAASTPERLRRVEGCDRPVRRDARGGAGGDKDRRQRDRSGCAEHAAPRTGPRGRPGARGRTLL